VAFAGGHWPGAWVVSADSRSNYWYSYAITIPTEVVAASIVISYWDSTTNAAVYITVLLVLILFINFWGARAYGEAEFWFSSIKVITIVGLIIL
jgi:amino acid transporter